ncbi:MAG: hypothetical protein OWR62_10890 [Sulfobacillus thermotolerans]|nr:hypothetical protein [Sulfobacillus thermotolerans]
MKYLEMGRLTMREIFGVSAVSLSAPQKALYFLCLDRTEPHFLCAQGV